MSSNLNAVIASSLPTVFSEKYLFVIAGIADTKFITIKIVNTSPIIFNAIIPSATLFIKIYKSTAKKQPRTTRK